ncbi:MAG: DUF3025 domain-containing protein [Betaproteobacteria bacterium]|nr:DUF3025 domain-containing protein [Betaproteobacteria bacterium]
MAIEVTRRPSIAALSHPAFEPLRPWLDRLCPLGHAEQGWPGLAALNTLAADAAQPPVTASGRPVRFCLPDPSTLPPYEQRIFDTGHVDTRPENLHDLFNALVWLAFPRTKAALNARHVARLPLEGAKRGRLRDLLTLMDEGGVIVACSASTMPELESLIRSFRWQTLFWERRAEVLRDMRFVLLGHSAYEKALLPYPGITCKALFFAATRERIEAPMPDLVAWLDEQTADWLTAVPDSATPRQMAPLPVFGYPGWLAASDCAEFYAERRWFRPERAGWCVDPAHKPASLRTGLGKLPDSM